MKKSYCVPVAVLGAIMLLAVMTAPVYSAQDSGDSSLQFGGSFFHAQNADVGTLNLEIAYGYFTTQSWEVGLIQTLGYRFIDGADDQWVASTIPFINYHFLGLSKDDVFQPFLGAFIGASYNEDDITGTMGPQVGFKSYVNDTTFVTVKYRYEWFFDDLTWDDVDDSSSDGNHVVTFGIGFIF